MPTLVNIGLFELAFGAVSGWAMVLVVEHGAWLRRHGVQAPARIRQAHLDYILMGVILIAVGLALPDIPTAIAVPVVFGTIVNPTLFVPLAFAPDVQGRLAYRAVTAVSFVALSGGLVAAAIYALSV